MSQEGANQARRELRSLVKQELTRRIKEVFPHIEKPTTRKVEAITWVALPLVEKGMRDKKAVQVVLDRRDDYV